MRVKEMIELVQQHHPEMGETEVIKLLNRANRTFKAKTDIDVKWATLSYSGTYDTTNGYFDVGTAPGNIARIKEVLVDDELISQLATPTYIGADGASTGKYYWWYINQRLYVIYDDTEIEILPSTVTTKIRYTSLVSSLSSLTDFPVYDEAFHEYLPYHVIAEGYEKPGKALQSAVYFRNLAKEVLREAKKYSHRRGSSGVIVQHDY